MLSSPRWATKRGWIARRAVRVISRELLCNPCETFAYVAAVFLAVRGVFMFENVSFLAPIPIVGNCSREPLAALLLIMVLHPDRAIAARLLGPTNEILS
jgi:hypothetical protein